MGKSVEIQAKTVHEAIEEALEKLGVAQDEVEIEILSSGGMFKKAKVLVTVKAGAEKPETSLKASPLNTAATDTAPVSPRAAAAVRSRENPADTAESRKVPADAISKKASAKVSVPKPEKENSVSGPADPNAAKFTKSVDFIQTLVQLLGNDAVVTSEMTERSFNINVEGENIGLLIGKGGEVLNAIQTLVSSIAISNANGEGKRVYINVGNYKERRNDTLKSLAIKKAEKVKETGRYVKLEPMNARDRAIIHTALQEISGIKTYSTGKDPFRCLCIAPADSPDCR